MEQGHAHYHKKRAIKSIIKKGMPGVVGQISLRALRASAIKA